MQRPVRDASAAGTALFVLLGSTRACLTRGAHVPISARTLRFSPPVKSERCACRPCDAARSIDPVGGEQKREAASESGATARPGRGRPGGGCLGSSKALFQRTRLRRVRYGGEGRIRRTEIALRLSSQANRALNESRNRRPMSPSSARLYRSNGLWITGLFSDASGKRPRSGRKAPVCARRKHASAPVRIAFE